MTTDIELAVRCSLNDRAARVPAATVATVRSAAYSPRRTHLGRRSLTGVLIVALGSAAAISVTGIGAPHPAAAAIAYVGEHPRLAITAMPPGFHMDARVAASGLEARLPSMTFVRTAGSTGGDIGVAEGVKGDGAMTKLASIAATSPSATTVTTVGQRTITIIDLGAAGAGSGYVAYFWLDDTTWAMVSGTPDVTIAQLVDVAGGITGSSG
jgi:hypothetical protein